MYPPFYIEPTYKVNHLKELYESGQAQKQAFLPVKATRNDQNASIFHDEITRSIPDWVDESLGFHIITVKLSSIIYGHQDQNLDFRQKIS